MNKRSISQLNGISRPEIPKYMGELDLFISASGQERGLELHNCYKENKSSISIDISIECDDALREKVAVALNNATPGEELKVGIDISLIHRKTLAELFALILHSNRDISLFIFYSLAKYAPPHSEVFPNNLVESVGIPFTGWCTKPGLPVTAIVGLGYEKNKALGAIEYLESSSSVLLLPNSSEESYKSDILKQNETLLSFTQEALKIDYDVQSPIDTILLLDSLIAGNKDKTKLVLLPFGPKIFFACSLIAAIAHPEVSVWHVSSVDHQNSLNQDRDIADIFGISCSISMPESV